MRYTKYDPRVQKRGLISVRRMVAGWASSVGSPVRGQDFLESGPIMIFGKKAIERLEHEYDAVADFSKTLDAACNFHLQRGYAAEIQNAVSI